MDKELKAEGQRVRIDFLEFDYRTKARYSYDRIDLYLINTAGFRLALRDKEVVAGSISLYKVELRIYELL